MLLRPPLHTLFPYTTLFRSRNRARGVILTRAIRRPGTFPQRSTIVSGSHMTDVQALGRARESLARRAWADSYRHFQEADAEVPLGPEDLERLATAAYLIGRDAESEAFRARAHQTFLNRGDSEGAARSALWLAFGLLQRGAAAPASGWFARAERI